MLSDQKPKDIFLPILYIVQIVELLFGICKIVRDMFVVGIEDMVTMNVQAIPTVNTCGVLCTVKKDKIG